MSWGWPQFATAGVIVLVLIIRLVLSACDLDKSTKLVFLDVVTESMLMAGLIMILRGAGFW